MASLSAGTRLGPFEIVAPLGAGGMGEVYRARDTRLDRDVAIKVLPKNLAENAEALARFEREAKAVAALSHPHILAIHDFGVAEGIAYAAVELVEGETLRQKLESGPVSTRKAVEWAAQIARGLGAAHERGIVHRDLKPENVMIGRDGIVKILDFGLARTVAAGAPGGTQSPTRVLQTEPGTVMGTVGYMSPEQVRGQEADHRSDIFSLGAVLFEMLSGKRAFSGGSAVETMSAILKEEPPEPAAASGRAVPPALDRIVRHCLEKAPEDRFQSCRDLVFDLESLSGSSTSGAAAPLAAASERRRRARTLGAAAAIALLAVAAGFFAGRYLGGNVAAPTGPITFQRITFRRGNILNARFAPDGQTIVYSAAWDFKPTDVYITRVTASESRSLTLPNTDLLAVSATGELAVLIKKGGLLAPAGGGTLARVSMSGGVPRELLEDVVSADWSPDGSQLAVARLLGGQSRIEYPLGHSLYTTSNQIRTLHVSPKDDLLAFFETDLAGREVLKLVDRKGAIRNLADLGPARGTLAWAPSGSEVLFSNAEAIEAVTLAGARRVIFRSAEQPVLHDVAKDGRLLAESFNLRRVMMWSPAEGPERELSWFDSSNVADISADGNLLLFGDRGGAYLRPTDGSSAVRLGDGLPGRLSPDGRWALTVVQGPPREMVLQPLGPGETKKIPTEGFDPITGQFTPDGRQIVWAGSAKDHGVRGYVQPLDGGTPRPFTPEGIAGASPISPDGRWLVARIGDDWSLFPLDGSEPRPLHGLDRTNVVIQWTADSKALFISRLSLMPPVIEQFDLASGTKTAWKELGVRDVPGVIGVNRIVISRDARSYAYTCSQVVHSDLYVVEGLR
jgi:hypothetical protein